MSSRGKGIRLEETLRSQFLALVEDLHERVTTSGAFVKEYWRAARSQGLYSGEYSTFRRAYHRWKSERHGVRSGRGSYANGVAATATATGRELGRESNDKGFPKPTFGSQRLRGSEDE